MVRRLAPLLALVLLAVPACSSVGESPAATVNGDEIGAQHVQDELEIMRSNPQYRQAVEQQYQVKLAGTGTGTFSSAFTAQVLSLQIYYRLFEQEMDRLGIAPSGSQERDSLANVRQQLKTLKGKKFPASYVKQLGHQDALVGKLQAEAATGKIGKDFLAKNAEDFEQVCVAHILVSTQSRSDAEAKKIADGLEAQLAAGADFATLAKANSDDPGSKEAGGDLGCNGRGAFVAEFEQAMFSQPVGKVGRPVKTQFGYHLIFVKSRQKPSAADLGDQLGQKAFDAFLLDLTCGAKTKVSINPRFGRWDRSACKAKQGLPRVTPPKAPASSRS
jgi:parvulin-like peptidyl-prolyl isomerase